MKSPTHKRKKGVDTARISGATRRKIYNIIMDCLFYYRGYMPDKPDDFNIKGWEDYDTGHAILTTEQIVKLLTKKSKKL